jgi:hypothetical protein
MLAVVGCYPKARPAAVGCYRAAAEALCPKWHGLSLSAVTPRLGQRFTSRFWNLWCEGFAPHTANARLPIPRCAPLHHGRRDRGQLGRDEESCVITPFYHFSLLIVVAHSKRGTHIDFSKHVLKFQQKNIYVDCSKHVLNFTGLRAKKL